MIPQFCKACGGRLEEMDREFCKAKECQTFARKDVMGATLSKDALLALLDFDIAHLPKNRAQAMQVIREEVRRYPYDDVSNFGQTRLKILKVWDQQGPIWETKEKIAEKEKFDETALDVLFNAKAAGIDVEKYLRSAVDEVLKRFKKDLTRIALSKPVEGVRLRIKSVRWHTDDLTGATDVHIDAEACDRILDLGIAKNRPIIPHHVIIAPCDGDAEFFSVPRGRTHADRAQADDAEISNAILSGTVKKRHVHLAQGSQLDGCGRRFSIVRKQNEWDPTSKVTIPFEPDVNLRKRILAVMPLERGDEVRTRDTGLAGLSFDRMKGTASTNSCHGRVAGKFDASHGKHLDIVAEMNGIKRKGGETDESLRSRLYQSTEE